MAIAPKFSPEVQAIIDAGLVTITRKGWMGGRSIWLWTKAGETIAGAHQSRQECEAAVLKWYGEGAAKLLKDTGVVQAPSSDR